MLPVVLFHAGVARLSGGFVGVDVFFVISGYLIGGLVYRDMREGRFTLRGFYERRARRILPALFLVVLACTPVACLLLSPLELRDFGLQSLATLTSISNFYFGIIRANYFAPATDYNPLLMTWSLGVEEQFYVLFPLLMFGLARLGGGPARAVLLVLSLISLGLAIWLVGRFPNPAFYLLPPRAWELGIGALLAMNEALRPPLAPPLAAFWREGGSAAGLALLLGGVVGYDGNTPFPALPALAPTIGALLLIAARGSWINRHVLSARPMVAVGLLSYSWYLWHWPLMSLARVVLDGLLPVRVGLALAGLALLLAAITYRWVEQPFRRGPAAPGLLRRYALASLACGVPALLLVAAQGWPARYPAARAVDSALSASTPDTCIASYRDSGLSRDPRCGDQASGRPTLALMGDSHAAALATYLRAAGDRAGWQVADFTKQSCPQLGTVTRYLPTRVQHATACAAFNARALAAVLAQPEIRTVLLAGYWSQPFEDTDRRERFVRAGQDPLAVSEAESWRNLEAGFADMLGRLRASGRRVILAADVPRFYIDPLIAARSRAIPPRAALRDMFAPSRTPGDLAPEGAQSVAMDARVIPLLERLATTAGASLLDLRARFCDGASCRIARGGLPLFVDLQHLSLAGAEFALKDAALFK